MLDTHTDCGQPPARAGLSRRAFLVRAAAAAAFGAIPVRASAGDGKLFLIGLEEHFATRELQRLNAAGDERLFSNGGRRPELLDLGAGRIADMDEAGIDIQGLSAVTPGAQNLPGAEGVAFARKLNAWVADEVIVAWPDRFRAFATLPLSRPEAATDELERSVRGLGDALASRILGGPGYGWHQEVALQGLRLIVAGAFDRFPGLQAVVGHMGEGLPFYYWRVGEDLDRIAKDRLHKPVQRYFHDNLWITTSAFFRDELLALALATMGEDRIMFSIDYPMASADWFRAVDLPRATKKKIAHKNAERLLGIGRFERPARPACSGPAFHEHRTQRELPVAEIATGDSNCRTGPDTERTILNAETLGGKPFAGKGWPWNAPCAGSALTAPHTRFRAAHRGAPARSRWPPPPGRRTAPAAPRPHR